MIRVIEYKNITEYSDPNLERRFISYCKNSNVKDIDIVDIEGFGRAFTGISSIRLNKLRDSFVKALKKNNENIQFDIVDGYLSGGIKVLKHII